ncbi:MAG: PTS glucose transporter subunit IIA [Atopobiaceae bacterium]|jgi:glucose-specific phosphotransferase system IIA component|nr:PTS glucose transporter subunit IIA [Atopobiaceae bacterium]MCH4180510.1 PTS glucose transporter subunit IIA [Atopobiaceae bacterium]MCH4214204.1 PTS glucose transporter subunit IIA [Atopobiaceae bacterium]MCH4230552.1 PTS glucose transporter subunit IIA [Atopobiaceae bacterium]MCH4275870.1 PTS glucose transporter subunit IIA [Atopobiaceae bacterium]
MGLFDKFKKAPEPDPITVHVAGGEAAAPVGGQVVPLAEVSDPVFSGGILGQGLGIKPDGDICYAPVSGTITATTATNHAIGLTSDEGVEVLIHIGVDTVDMQGDGFKRLVEKDDHVVAGVALVTFDRDKIKAAGHDDVVICVISNTAELASVEPCAEGTVRAGDRIIRVSRS